MDAPGIVQVCRPTRGGRLRRSGSAPTRPEPVFLRWRGMEKMPDGDFFVRSGPGTVNLPPESAERYIETRFTFGGAPA